jgi:FkbM family methyltransferase
MIFLRKVIAALLPRSWYLKSTLSNGAILYGLNRPGFGGRGVFIFGDALEPELQHLEKFLDPGGVLIDIGANTGAFSLKAARHVGDAGMVIALEPNIEILATLHRSVRANGFRNVRLRNCCAAARTGSATLWMNCAKPHSFSIKNRLDNAEGIPVLAVSVDDLLGWEKIDRVDYLKIDAEGAENDILLGAAGTIERHRPIIQAEVSIEEHHAVLPGYGAFGIAGSPNILCVPDSHPKLPVLQKLGWKRAPAHA